MPSFSTSDSFSTSFTSKSPSLLAEEIAKRNMFLDSNRTEPPSIRDQLETVIEMMGPETPHFYVPQNINNTTAPQGAASDADNEDSSIATTVTTVIGSVTKRKFSRSAPESPRDVICLKCNQLKMPNEPFLRHYKNPRMNNTKSQMFTNQQRTDQIDNRLKINDKKSLNRMDVYYFDHGNAAFYKTNDNTPVLVTEVIAEKTEQYTTRFWAQIFGTIHIPFAFATSFLLQFSRFVLFTFVKPLTVGLIQTVSDYFLKPFLAVVFNGILQPPLIFLYNVMKSIRDVFEPISETLGTFLREIGQTFKWFRIVHVSKNELLTRESTRTVAKK